MTAPVLARGIPGRHYVWPPNSDTIEYQFPSVTACMSQLGKPFLIPWASKVAAEFAVNSREAWDHLDDQAAIDVIKRAHIRIRDAAGNRGSRVHAAVEAWIHDGTTDIPELEDIDDLPYIAAALAFMGDMVEEVLHFESTIFNVTYQYAGTCDLLCRLKDGRVAVVDWKTSNKIYPDVGIQLVAYGRGEWIGTPEGEKKDMPDVDLGLVVHLKDDGSWTAREVELSDRLFKTFVALRTLAQYRGFVEPDVLGATHKGEAPEIATPSLKEA